MTNVLAGRGAGDIRIGVISFNLKLFKVRKEYGPLKGRILRVLLTIKARGVLPKGS